jgi:ABC-type transport system substrate-binding protein
LSSSAFNELKYGRELQLCIDEILAWIDDPWYILNLNSTTTAWENRINYSNPEFDKIVDEAAFILDVEKRNKMFAEAQRIFVEDIPWIPISQPNYNFAVNENIEGYVQFFDELVRFNTMKSK